MGSSLARVKCETSQVLLVGGQVIFLGDLPFSPHLAIGSAQNGLHNLYGPLNPIKKQEDLGLVETHCRKSRAWIFQ